MENQCPICKEKNNCEVHNQSHNCWCTKLQFPSVNMEELVLPNVCICSDCAKKLGAKENSMGKFIHINKNLYTGSG